MIVVDSSVWIDYFNGIETDQTDALDRLMTTERVGVGDLILSEVLCGFRTDSGYRTGRRLMTSFPCFDMLGTANAIRAAEHYRALRKRGVTIRKTADVIIASFCIAHDHELLFSDRDFVPFVDHLGLRTSTPMS